MTRSALAAVPICIFMFSGAMSAQAPAKVDFATDVQPLLRQECLSCHGPAKQEGGMRLDRKSSVLMPLSRRVTPGNSANSMVYHRVIGNEFGAQMPPTGDLKPEQVAILKNWIDQGAVWPDALSNEAELAPLNPEAVAAVDMLHNGDFAGFMKAVTKQPSLLNARGPEGSTPFMYAVLYAGPAMLERLLKMGADPNQRNDNNSTATIWGAHDLEKTRVLLAHAAKVNVMSSDFRTPLMVAARRPGGAPIVKLLLEHGADPNPNKRPYSQSSPLLEAATAGDAPSVELLLAHGATVKSDAEQSLVMAVINRCDRCVELLVPRITDKDVYSAAMVDTALVGDPKIIKMMLDHGADPKTRDGFGKTALMYLAASDELPLDAVKLVVKHGGDVNAVTNHFKAGDEGKTVLDMSQWHGPNPVLEYLVTTGAKPSVAIEVTLHPRASNDMRSAIQDSLPLLQVADANFSKKSGCVSCHDNSLTAMTMSMARKQGFRIDEKVDAAQVQTNVGMLARTRDQMHQGFVLGIPVADNFSEGVEAYILLGLGAEGYKADLNTDAAAMHILWHQHANGEWPEAHADTRQPLCLDYIGETALSMRALQLYAPKLGGVAYHKAIELAAGWLATAESSNNDDRSWRVTGLAWAGTNKPALQKAMQELVAKQKSDGGWSDLQSMDSTAYATGKSLVALHLGGMAASDPVYRRGVKWLLSHQEEEGSWYVHTRALAFQPDFDAGFPHGHNQWISAAGTNWAAMALTMALPDTKSMTASRVP